MKKFMQMKFEIYIKRWRSRLVLNKQAVLLLFLFSLFSMSYNILEGYAEDNQKFVSSVLLIQLNLSYFKVYTYFFSYYQDFYQLGWSDGSIDWLTLYLLE